MKSCLATGLLLAFSTAASAQERPPVTVETMPEPYVVSHPFPTAEPGMVGRTYPILNKHGLCCNAHHSWFGCGNFHSEMTFIFGSCRTFFGEPCFPKPPRAGLFGGSGLFGGGGLGIFGRNSACSTCK